MYRMDTFPTYRSSPVNSTASSRLLKAKRKELLGEVLDCSPNALQTLSQQQCSCCEHLLLTGEPETRRTWFSLSSSSSTATVNLHNDYAEEHMSTSLDHLRLMRAGVLRERSGRQELEGYLHLAASDRFDLLADRSGGLHHIPEYEYCRCSNQSLNLCARCLDRFEM